MVFYWSIGQVVFLLTDNFDQHALLPVTVEFAVKNLFPGAEIQFAPGDGHDHFSAHHLALQMRIGIVFSCTIMPILTDWLMWSKLL